MKLIAEAPTPATPSVAESGPAAAAPAWPLLDALARPAEVADPRGPAAGTLVQLFGAAAAPVPAALPAAAPPPLAAGTPAAPATGPFPATWAPHGQAKATAPAGAPGLVPADRVTTPLAEVMQTLGRGGEAPNPAFAGLRLPGSGPR